jgi:hypothetical protein
MKTVFVSLASLAFLGLIGIIGQGVNSQPVPVPMFRNKGKG